MMPYLFPKIRAFTLLELLISLSISAFLTLALMKLQAEMAVSERLKFEQSQQINALLNAEHLLRSRFARAIFTPQCAGHFNIPIHHYEFENTIPDFLPQRLQNPLQIGRYTGTQTIDAQHWPTTKATDYTQEPPVEINLNTQKWTVGSDFLKLTYLQKIPVIPLVNHLQSASNSLSFNMDKDQDPTLGRSMGYFLATDCQRSFVFMVKRATIGSLSQLTLSETAHLSLKTFNLEQLQLYHIQTDVLSIQKNGSDRPYLALSEINGNRFSIHEIEHLSLLIHTHQGWQEPSLSLPIAHINAIGFVLTSSALIHKHSQNTQRYAAPLFGTHTFGHDLILNNTQHQFIRVPLLIGLHQ